MRPRKVILILDSNEQQLSVLACILYVNGYRVLKASTEQEAITTFSAAPLRDLVVIDEGDGPKFPGRTAARKIKAIRQWVPMLILVNPSCEPGLHPELDAFLARRSLSSFELLEMVKLMSARKRGPRKGTPRMSTICTQ